jgi:uncharacterized protein (TIGR00369 family)
MCFRSRVWWCGKRVDNKNKDEFDKPIGARSFPVADFLGISFSRPSEGLVVAQMRAQSHHRNPMGTLHGGILCDLADAAMGVAFASTLSAGESFTTLELKINFLRPVWDALLTAEAQVVSRGRTVGMAECKIMDEKNRFIAKATSTCMVLAGEAAKNR